MLCGHSERQARRPPIPPAEAADRRMPTPDEEPPCETLVQRPASVLRCGRRVFLPTVSNAARPRTHARSLAAAGAASGAAPCLPSSRVSSTSPGPRTTIGRRASAGLAWRCSACMPGTSYTETVLGGTCKTNPRLAALSAARVLYAEVGAAVPIRPGLPLHFRWMAGGLLPACAPRLGRGRGRASPARNITAAGRAHLRRDSARLAVATSAPGLGSARRRHICTGTRLGSPSPHLRRDSARLAVAISAPGLGSARRRRVCAGRHALGFAPVRCTRPEGSPRARRRSS
jgi:hypothetical protein